MTVCDFFELETQNPNFWMTWKCIQDLTTNFIGLPTRSFVNQVAEQLKRKAEQR